MVALQSRTGSLFQKSQVCRQTMLHVSNTGPRDARVLEQLSRRPDINLTFAQGRLIGFWFL